MERTHGFWYAGDDPHSGRLLCPTYHPAAGMRDPILYGHFLQETLAALEVAKVEDWADKDSPGGAVRTWGTYSPDGTYEWCDDPKELWAYLKGAPIIAVDTETKLDGSPLWIQVSVRPGHALVLDAHSEDHRATLRYFLEEPVNGTLTVVHNALFDLPVLAACRIFPTKVVDTMVMAYLLQLEPQGLKPLAYRHFNLEMESYPEVVRPATLAKARDYLEAVVAFGDLWPEPEPISQPDGKVKKPHGALRRAKAILRDMAAGKDVDPLDRWSNLDPVVSADVAASFGPLEPATLADVPGDRAIDYAGRDADATLRVYSALLPQIEAQGLTDALTRDMAVLPMVQSMIETGVRIDLAKARELSVYFGEEMQVREDAMRHAAGHDFNPGSPKQVSAILFDELGLPTVNGRSADVEVLGILEVRHPHPVVTLLREWRGYQKLKGTYADKIPELVRSNGRIHPEWRITRTATGRLSAARPNLMAVPVRTEDGRRIREAYVPEPGHLFVSADYSQIEMRLAAHVSGDEKMLQIFADGLDIHSQTASWMFDVPVDNVDPKKHRYPAKRVGFGVLYGLGAEGLQTQLATEGLEWSLDQCDDAIRRWFSVFTGVRDFMSATHAHARRYGWVEDLVGRRRWIPTAKAKGRRLVEEALKQAGNAPIQMGAQSIMKQAMADLWVELQKGHWFGIRPIIQVHDDLILEVPEGRVDDWIPVMVNIMENADVRMGTPLLTGLAVEPQIGPTWAALELWKGASSE
jgi:DNA polymerase I-like protein with 3'-5' exonuclease and polymerase domains